MAQDSHPLQSTKPLTDELRPDTLNFLLDQVSAGHNYQIATAESQDRKLFSILTAASVVMGLTAALGLSSHPAIPRISAAFIAGAAVAYVTLVPAVVVGIWPRSWKTLDYGELWTKYWSDELLQTKHGVIESLSKNFRRNKPNIQLKSKLLVAASVLLGVEVVLVAAAVIAASTA